MTIFGPEFRMAPGITTLATTYAWVPHCNHGHGLDRPPHRLIFKSFAKDASSGQTWSVGSSFPSVGVDLFSYVRRRFIFYGIQLLIASLRDSGRTSARSRTSPHRASRRRDDTTILLLGDGGAGRRADELGGCVTGARVFWELERAV